MKVLQVNIVYKIGSTGKIVQDIRSILLKENIENLVCYGNGKKVIEDDIYKTSCIILCKINNLISRFSGCSYGGSYIATYKLIRFIKKEKPDIVHLHCLNGYFVNIYKLLNFLKINNIKTIITLHAEFMYTGSCSHSYECDKWKTGCGHCPDLYRATRSLFFDKTHYNWIKMKKAFDGFDNIRIISVSQWIMDRAKQSPILLDKKHNVIMNGVDTEIFKYKNNNFLKEKLGIKDEKIILHVTVDFMNSLKGGKYVIEIAEKMKNENIKIIIIGNQNKKLNLPSNIIDVGRIENQEELADYYSMADITLLTSRRESFSMVCVESLCCGTPIIGFKAGAPEMISIEEYSDFVDYQNVDELICSINKKLGQKIEIGAETIVAEAKLKYGKEEMAQKYIDIYKDMIRD